MFTPFPKGTYTKNDGRPYRFLIPGRRYRVVKEFQDYDSDVHAAGEEWTFLTFNFVPYHDGLSLIVSLDGEREWIIQLQTIPEEQLHISENPEQYFAAIG